MFNFNSYLHKLLSCVCCVESRNFITQNRQHREIKKKINVEKTCALIQKQNNQQKILIFVFGNDPNSSSFIVACYSWLLNHNGALPGDV